MSKNDDVADLIRNARKQLIEKRRLAVRLGLDERQIDYRESELRNAEVYCRSGDEAGFKKHLYNALAGPDQDGQVQADAG